LLRYSWQQGQRTLALREHGERMNWRKLYDKRSTSPTASQNNFQRTRLADDQVHTLPPRPTLTKPLLKTESDTKNFDSTASSAHIRHAFRSRHLPLLLIRLFHAPSSAPSSAAALPFRKLTVAAAAARLSRPSSNARSTAAV